MSFASVCLRATLKYGPRHESQPRNFHVSNSLFILHFLVLLSSPPPGEPSSLEDSVNPSTYPLPRSIDGLGAANAAAASRLATAAMAASMSKFSAPATATASRGWWPKSADAVALLGEATRALSKHRVASARAQTPAQRDRFRGASAAAPWLNQMQQGEDAGSDGGDGGYGTADQGGEGRRGEQQQQRKEKPRFEFERVLVDFVLLTFLVSE